jgi:hypothetical protein
MRLPPAKVRMAVFCPVPIANCADHSLKLVSCQVSGGCAKSSTNLPPRLQNLFEQPRDKARSRAESDFLTLQAYAPEWRPGHKVNFTCPFQCSYALTAWRDCILS